MCCSVVFGITLRLFVINISSSLPQSTPPLQQCVKLAERWPWSTGNCVDNTWHVSVLTAGTKARYSLRIAISAYPTCIRPPPPVRGSLSEYRHPAWYVRETRMVGLPDGEKSLTIRLLVSTQLTNVTDTQTDTA